MTLSANGVDFLKRREDLRLEAYRDSVGVWTIGYGHTGTVVEGQTITEDQAEFFLQQDSAHASQAINRLVKVPLSQNQFDALVSFVFNIGVQGFESSTTLARLNRGDYAGAAEAMTWWNRGKIKGKKVILPGLVARRKAERALFLA